MRRYLLVILTSLVIFLPISEAGSIDIIQKGISGSISCDITIVEADEKILIGTALGVYVFTSEGDLYNFIQTGSMVTNIKTISDINNDGIDEIIFTTQNSYFPNVLCYDIKTSEKLWEFSSETEVFDVDMLWTMKQVNVFDLEVSNSYDYIYLTAGYNTYCLDSLTGEKIATYQGTDNMWDITIVSDDIVVGDQNGYVYRLDGETLNTVWKKLVSSPYTVVNPSTKSTAGTVTRSVWDIVYLTYSNSQILAVTCEDGYLYTLDFETGAIQNSKEIIDYVDSLLYAYYSDYPLPTSSSDYNFLNNRVTTIPDVTGDGYSDLLVYTYPGSRTGSEYQGAKTGIYIIDSLNLNLETKNENIELSRINEIETITSESLDETYILMPIGKSGSYEKLRLITLDDLTTYKTISVNSTSSSSNSNSYYVKALEDDTFILCSNYGDLIKSDIDGKISWTYQRLASIEISNVDLVGTSTPDLLIESVEGVNSYDDSEYCKHTSRVLYAIDGDTNEISWSYEMPFEEYINTTGLQGVQTFDDINSDGKIDIVAYKQRRSEWGSGDEYGKYTRLLVFASNGSIIYEKPLTTDTYYGVYETYLKDSSFLASRSSEEIEWMKRDKKIRKTIESLDIISDINSDDISDFIIGSWNEIYVTDGKTGEIIWTRTYNKENYEPPNQGTNPMDLYYWDWVENDRLEYYSLGDQNADGYDELLQVSWDEMNILRSKNFGNSFDYSVYKEITFSNGNFDENCVQIIDDMNGDGFKDIICQVYIEDSPSVYKVINGKDGTEIIEIQRDGTTIDLGPADFDGDSYKDSIIFHSYGSGGPRLEIISGSTNDAIWTYLEFEETWMLNEMYGISSLMPACYVDDVNSDGIKDLAVGRSLPWDAGAEVIIYDASQNSILKTINVEAIDPDMDVGNMRWQPAVVIAHLSDLTGDGISEIAAVMSLGSSNQKQLKLVVIDVAKGEIISDFLAKGTKVEDFGEMIATYGTGGELYLLNPTKEISITSPSDGQTVSSPLKITWSEGEDAETVKIVKVDNKNIMNADGDSVVSDIRAGNRKISIYAFDEYGKGIYANVDVNVKKTSSTETPMIFLFLALFVVLFVPKILPIALKKKYRGKASKENIPKKEDE